MFVGKSVRRFLSFVLFLTVIACFDIQTAAAEEREENAQTGEYYIYSTDENGATLHEYGVMDGYETPETISIPAELNGTKLYAISGDALNGNYSRSGGRAVYNADGVKTLILPEGLVKLMSLALNGAYGFERITFPSTLVETEDNFLFDVTATIEVAEGNPRYDSVNGFLIDRQKNSLIYAAPVSADYPLPEVEIFAENSLKHYQPEQIVFPHTAKIIEGYAVYDNTETLSVIVPGNVEEIGDNAFYGMLCSKIILEDGIKRIGAQAFYDTEITELTIPGSVEWLGYDLCGEEVIVHGQPADNCHWETEEEYEDRMEALE